MSLLVRGESESLSRLRALLDGGELLTTSSSRGFGSSEASGTSVVSRHSDLFVLGTDRALRATRLRDCKLRRTEIVKEVKCLHPLPANVVEMKFNSSSECLAVRSDTELHLVLMPSDVLRSGFASEESSFRCRSLIVIGEHESSAMTPSKIVQVNWHPKSNSHICVLFADNTFRMFALNQLECTWDLVISNRVLQRDQYSAFCFGAGTGWSQFTVFLFHRDGELYCLCPIVPKHLLISEQEFKALHQSVAVRQQCGPSASNSSAVATVPSSADDADSQRAQTWLESCWKQRTQSDDSFFIGTTSMDDMLSVRVQGPLSIVPEPERPRHVQEQNSASCFSITAIGSSIPASIIAVAFSSGHVDILLNIDAIRPSWRSLLDSRIGLNLTQAPPLLFLHRVELDLIRPDPSLSFLPSFSIDSLVLLARDGVYEVSSISAREILRSIEGNECSLDRVLLNAKFPSRKVLKLDRGRQVGVHRITDPLLGYFTLAIDEDFRVHVAETVPFDDSPATDSAPPATSVQMESPFTVPPLKLSAPLEAHFSRQPVQALSSAENLKAFVKDAEAMFESINAIRSTRQTLLQRVEFGDKFAAIQAAYVGRIADSLEIVQTRQEQLQNLMKTRVNGVHSLVARVERLFDHIQQRQNELSAEEREFHAELDRYEALQPSMESNCAELQSRVERLLKHNETDRMRSWTRNQRFQTLSDSHCRRLNPTLKQQFESLEECIREIKKLQSLVNTEFPDALDVNLDELAKT